MNTQRDRDASVERLLRRSLAADDSSAAGACPDAETLAAWVDGGLGAGDVALVEAHASGCARCQALVAAVVRAAPDPSRAASAETSWRSWNPWQLRWLVPLAAGAAAVILWVAVPNDARRDRPEQATAQLPAASPAPPQQPDAVTDRFNANAPAVSSRERGVAKENRARAEDKTAGVGVTEQAQRKEEQRETDATASRLAAPPVDRLDARARAAAPAASAPEPQSALNKTAELSGPARGGARIEITSPDPTVRWRIGAGGLVELTRNGGNAWEAVPTGVRADMTAGVAPSPLVCWIVGRAGTVLLSTDGRNLQQVSFPETADLAAVQATNAKTATITTVDGRRFRTTDGGATWALLQGF